ncbi:GGDEF domain-containing protein [Anaerorhabdus furcosa]|uniref:Diguanylate cyclase (GGDEF) domain-containing protein n=1 Tax=Anaerorhabdus furcosa TaxID=118967 RepID=A0A1T4Q1G9_9FIRM|nr:GGDEF domain-containing protein [Anaerorhabdus furcosa]SJZ97612.1 diguanylate cyclase (GGDEF) domain-containing protein [Anaerorhabdus furcosa]
MNVDNYNLVMLLSNLLVDTNAATTTVQNALDLIAKTFAFKQAYVYETNRYGFLELKEFISPWDNVEKKLSLHLFEEKIHHESSIIYTVSKLDDENQDELLGIFKTSKLFFVPHIIDKRIGELVLFVEGDEPVEDRQILGLCGSMLLKYIMPRMYDNQLINSRKALESIIDNTGIDIYVNDFYTHEILYVNQSMAKPYGGQDKFENRKCWEVLFPSKSGQCEFCPQKNLIDENGDPTKVYTWDYQRELDGSWFRVFSAAFRWIDGRLAHVVSSADITDNKKNEALIEYLANYDSLTGLPNRRMLVTECDRRINQVNTAITGYLLFFDIDGFKMINDTYGHDIGDEFLISLGDFFKSIDVLKNAIYRNGGDEFVAIIDGNISEDELCVMIGKIHEKFDKPWKLKTVEAKCNVSVGIACYPTDGKTAEELLLKADQAMYKVKKAGGGSYLFGRDL